MKLLFNNTSLVFEQTSISYSNVTLRAATSQMNSSDRNLRACSTSQTPQLSSAERLLTIKPYTIPVRAQTTQQQMSLTSFQQLNLVHALTTYWRLPQSQLLHSPVIQEPPMVKKASSNLPLVLLAPVGKMNSSVSCNIHQTTHTYKQVPQSLKLDLSLYSLIYIISCS